MAEVAEFFGGEDLIVRLEGGFSVEEVGGGKEDADPFGLGALEEVGVEIFGGFIGVGAEDEGLAGGEWGRGARGEGRECGER
jgi:hypothetical protein